MADDLLTAIFYFTDKDANKSKMNPPMSVGRLRIMPAQFMILPAQACRCLISNIAPPAGQPWEQVTLEAMLHVVRENINQIKAQLIVSIIVKLPQVLRIVYT